MCIDVAGVLIIATGYDVTVGETSARVLTPASVIEIVAPLQGFIVFVVRLPRPPLSLQPGLFYYTLSGLKTLG